MQYKLTARYNGKTRRATVYGSADNMPQKIWQLMCGSDDPQIVADSDAAMSAIAVVMNRASKDEVWAKGEVILSRQDGTVVKTMPAK